MCHSALVALAASLLCLSCNAVVLDENQNSEVGDNLFQCSDRILLQKQSAMSKVALGAEPQKDCSDLVEKKATNKPLDFANLDHDSHGEGLYVNPDQNIAFCLIEKNACSRWTAIFSKIELGDLGFTQPNYGLAQRTFTVEKATAVFENLTATRGVFVRDPLERFLSGFLDTCFERGCRSWLCFMRESSQVGEQISFSQAVAWLLKQDLSTLEGHFRPQAYHCELDKRVDEYNVIGRMGGLSLASTASCFLERAGLQQFNVISNASGSDPFWHESQGPSTSDYLTRFYTPESAEAVYNAFSIDYHTFNLSRPDWLDSATGEFYESKSGTGCNKSVSALQIRDDDTDIWDIPMLAERAGFRIQALS